MKKRLLEIIVEFLYKHNIKFTRHWFNIRLDIENDK